MSLSLHFFKVFRNDFFKKSKVVHFGSSAARYSKIYEPDYLILGQTKTPEYDLVNFQLKGYDFAVVEQFQKYISGLANMLNITISNSWAAPQKDFTIHHYKPNSTEIEYKYDLKMCERNVQVCDVKSHIMTLFIEAVITACPPGVNISIHEHTPEMDEDRYVPDFNIIQLEQKLEEVDSKNPKKKK